MNRGAAAGRLVLRAFIAFRIETPSGNIFPRANLIKARQSGLLNEQTVAAPQHAARTARRCSRAKAHWQVAGRCKQMQFYASVFLISLLSSRAAPARPAFFPSRAPSRKSPPPRRRSLWSSGPFPISPHLPAGKWIPRSRRIRNIY